MRIARRLNGSASSSMGIKTNGAKILGRTYLQKRKVIF